MGIVEKKGHLSSIAMVQRVLQDYSGTFFSAKELTEKIIEEFSTHICKDTVVRAVDQVKQSNRYFMEKTERRGRLNLPVKVFCIKLPIENL